VQELEAEGLSVTAVAVGRKGRDYLLRRGVEVDKAWTGLLAEPGYEAARAVGVHVVEGYLEPRFDRVDLVFAHFRSVISQVATCRQLLPIAVEPDPKAKGTSRTYLFEPSDEEVLDALLPRYIEVQVFRGLLESAASEQGARMTAMDSATRNAGEVIKKLTLVYNRTRQEAVTKELLDIIGGVEALKAG
jgi:F-type H+-transporting ATPase subunit gamma